MIDWRWVNLNTTARVLVYDQCEERRQLESWEDGKGRGVE